VYTAIIDQLRVDGHTVRAIRETDQGLVDPDVLAIAVNEQSLLLTQDKDFGELVVRFGMKHCGIVLIRLAGMAIRSRSQVVCELLRDHAKELPMAFTVISRGGVRIRQFEIETIIHVTSTTSFLS